MSGIIRIFSAMGFALAISGCSFSPQADFVPVDSSKYATAESLQAGLKQAQKECATIKSKKASNSALNIQKAVFENNAQTQTSYNACMEIRGFVRSGNPPAQ